MEYSLPPNPLFEESKDQNLDLKLIYLWKVHGYCYYTAEKYDDEYQMTLKCGSAYCRPLQTATEESSFEKWID